MPKNETEAGISEESIGFLEDVRKGKPRKFVMITKGQTIVSLVVYKKGSVEKFKKEAKEAGTGTISYGVVDGKGPNINFKLARSEGFDKEPTTPAKVKAFLKDSADFKSSPSFEIVEEQSPVLDTDDPLVARFVSLQQAAEKAAQEHPQRASEINGACQDIAKILDQDPSSDAAYDKIGALEKLLTTLHFGDGAPKDGAAKGDAGATTQTPPKSPPQPGGEKAKTDTPPEAPKQPAPPKPPVDGEAGKFKTRLAELLKQATPYVATIGNELKSLATEARGFADQANYADANERLKRMVELIAKAKATPATQDGKDQMAKFSEAVANLKPGLEQLKAGDAEAKLKASEAGALAKQGAGQAQKGSFEDAMSLVGQAAELVETAVNELQERQKKLAAALDYLRSAQRVVTAVKTDILAALGALPKAFEERIATVEKSLALEKETDPEKIEKAADDSGDAIADIDKDAKELIEDKRAYDTDLGLIEGRIKALESHAKATVEFLKGKIETLKNQVAAAKLLAGKHEYADAATSLREVAKASLEAETLADQHAQYAAILVDRTSLITALPSSAGHEDLEKKVEAVKDKFNRAKEHATKNEFGKAVELLNQLPQDCIDTQWAIKRYGEYNTKRTNLDLYIKAREREPDVQEVSLYLDRIKKLYEDSDYAKTKDFAKSLTLLERADGMDTPLYQAIELLKEFRKQRKAAVDAIKALELHAGKPAILDEISRFKSDLVFANTKKTAQEFATGTNVCLNILKLAADAKKKADECKAYLDRLKEVKALLKNFDKRTAMDSESLEVDSANQWIATAANLATAKKWVEALEAVEQAAVHCQKAKTVANNGKWLEKQLNDLSPLFSDLAKNWNRAWRRYEQMLSGIEGGAGTSRTRVQELLNDAKTAAGEAQAAATSPTPDFGTAQAKLVEALQSLSAASLGADLGDAYDSLRQKVWDRWNAIDNLDGAFDDEFDAISDKIQNEADPEADKLNFGDAEAHLNAAAQMCLDLARNVQIYRDYRALRDGSVQDSLDNLDTIQGHEAFNVEVPKLIQDVNNADDALSKKKYQEAYDALKKLEVLAKELSARSDKHDEARSHEKSRITDIIGDIQGQPLVADHLQQVEADRVELRKMFDERRFEEADRMTLTIYWKIKYAKDILARRDKYVVERDKAKDALDKLKLVACDANRADITALEKTYAKAEEYASDKNFETAMPHLETVIKGCVEPTKIGKAFDEYAQALKTAQDAVAALTKDFRGSEAVALEVAGLNARLADAAKLAAGKSLAAAKQAADEVAAACVEVRKTADGHKEFADASQSAATGAKDKVDGMDGEINELRGLAGKLASRNLGDVLKDDLARINKLLEAAEKERTANNAPKARAAIADAAQACAHANSMADQFVQVDKAIQAAATKVDSVRKTYAEPPVIKLTMDNLDKELLMARRDADGKLFSSALNIVTSVHRSAEEMADVGVQYARYVEERKRLEPRVEKLAKSKARYMVAKEIGEIRAFLAESQTLVNACDFKEAMQLLASGADLCGGAELKADMHEEKEPTKEQLGAILNKPDGEKQLDKIIETLDPKAKRKVCKLALEMRFNVKLELFTDKDGNLLDTDGNKKAPDIVKFYAVMQALPKSHTGDNPSLDKVKRLGDETGTSSYNKGTRVTELRIGRATDKTERMIAQEWEMGDVDDDAKPSDDQPPTKFNWTTLHEIGHSVDDRLNFMRRNGSQADYGGWKEYGANVGEIGKVAADHFQYDQEYITAYLAGEKRTPPEPTGKYRGVELKEWDRRRVEAETWCDSIRHGKSIYYNASATDRSLIGDKTRVYQEAYANQWVSYLYAARKKAVAGYQFRAPGEWFAELYAAYHTGKMNKKHPARKWLDQLK